jgi:hypothetical protein
MLLYKNKISFYYIMSVYHPALRSSIPTTLTAQMPRSFVRADRFPSSRVSGSGMGVDMGDYSGMEGEGILDDIRNAFKPKNIAKAFKPVTRFADKTGITKFVTKTLPKTLIEKGVPMAAEFVGSKFGYGKQARALGERGAKELKKVSGLGLKKGSPEMKAHMAKLRAMRKKK